MSDTITKKLPKVISGIQEFHNWLLLSSPGEKIIYHTGYLAKDRLKEEAAEVNEDINSLALTVWNAFEKGKITLLQKRDKINSVHYIAVRLKEKTR